ncbi:MAG: hypothetical protein H6Q20_472 [Bacteroidetes bacterium]|nr:hypothetical protein [Bacteroidota bacterium]
MLNDSLILTKVYLKSLTLENLPDGEYKVNFQSYNPAYTQKLNETLLIRIENGGTSTSLIAVPPKSKASWIAKGVITSAAIVFLLNPLY